MDLDTLLNRYFGTNDPATLDPLVFETGREQLAVDFGVEQDPGRRFALWALMDALACAPTPEEAFEDRALQEAAHAYRKAAWRAERG